MMSKRRGEAAIATFGSGSMVPPDITSRPEEMSERYRRYVLWLLMISCALNFLDRQVINILAEPIKREFGLSDTQLGLLTGLAFAAFYTTMSLPVARLADRANRSWLIATFVSIWSLATAASGLVTSYAQLFAARVVVGMGEAGGSPSAQSFITDYTPPERRSSALAFYQIGVPLGALVGLVLGGVVLDFFGWRTAFIVAGLPGLLLAFVIATTLHDPKRERENNSSEPKEPFMPLGEALREMAAKRAFVLVWAGGALTTFVNFSQGAFIASFFFRAHGESLGGIAASATTGIGSAIGVASLLGVGLGFSKGIAGIVGTLLGGRLGDKPGDAAYLAHVTVPAVATLLRIPLFAAALLVPNVWMCFMLVALHSFAMGAAGVGGHAAIQGLVRPRARATAAAVYMFALNMIGLGFGPLVVGAISDGLSQAGLGETEGLRWALLLTSLLLLGAFACKWAARRTIVADSVS